MNNYLLDSVVSEWIAINGKTENQRARLYTIAVACLREINMDVNGIIKIVELSINDNDTVDLPEDFMNYSKIGILGADGRIHCLGRDNSINMKPSYNDCGVQVANPNTDNSDFPFNGLPFAGYFYGSGNGEGAIFGLGGGNNNIGYYRLDRANNQLLLANMNIRSGANLIMEYVADINVSSDGDFYVHPYIVETIKRWIDWMYVNNDKNTSQGEKLRRERIYYNALRISKSRYGASTIEEWYAALRTQNSATPRF
ncbi:MAG: hypothetical protein V4549_07400 [Bacteroidota bacterium]